VPRCPNLVREMERFKKQQRRVGSQTVIMDKANRGGNCHLVECWEYAAAHGLSYIKPRVSIVRNDWVDYLIAQRERREKQRFARASAGKGRSISLAPRGVT